MRSTSVWTSVEGRRPKRGETDWPATHRARTYWLRAVGRGFLLSVLLAGWLSPAPEVVNAALTVDAPMTGHEGDMYWRWIGISQTPENGDLCGVPSNWEAGWSSRLLFQSPLVDSYPELRSFCVWEYDGTVPLNESFQSLRCLDEKDGHFEHFIEQSVGCSSSDFVDIEPDILAVTPSDIVTEKDSAHDFASLVDLQLESLFLEQAGDFNFELYFGAPDVRLTLVDTSPTVFDPMISETSPHGESLRRLAQELLCLWPQPVPASGCLADIRSRLALAYEASFPWRKKTSGRNEEEGGYSGLIGELGEALIAELDEFQASNQDVLVMNLSVAWDRIYGGGSPVSQMPPSAQAVYRAMEAVACEGALVLAAAGNLRDHHPDNEFTQPMLPAAWANRESTACVDQPQLLWATGAFDSTRRPVSNSLAEGMPEFAAYGDHAVAAAGIPTPPLTGSSVSTLLVSAASSAAAYYDPASDRQGVMASVYSGGELIPEELRSADFCSPVPEEGPCPPISYVSVCSAAYEACLKSSCPPSLPPCPSRSGSKPVFEAAAFLNFGAPIQGFPFNCNVPGCAQICKTDNPQGFDPIMAPEVCPRRQHHSPSRRPGTQPQPEVGLCPSCLYDSGAGDFYGEVELGPSEWAENPTLHLTCNGVESNYLLAPSLTGIPGQTTVVKKKWTGLPLSCESASLSYNIHKGSQRVGSTTVPILVGTLR